MDLVDLDLVALVLTDLVLVDLAEVDFVLAVAPDFGALALVEGRLAVAFFTAATKAWERFAWERFAWDRWALLV